MIELLLHLATADMACQPRERIVAELAGRYGETVVGSGLSADGRVIVEIFAGPSGSWTAVVTDTGGVSCIAQAGRAWLASPPLFPERMPDMIAAARFWAGAWLYQLGRALICIALTCNGNGLSYAEARAAYLDMVERAGRQRRGEAEHV
jgi:hypothetical protein